MRRVVNQSKKGLLKGELEIRVRGFELQAQTARLEIGQRAE